jgi:hypothetical protein
VWNALVAASDMVGGDGHVSDAVRDEQFRAVVEQGAAR